VTNGVAGEGLCRVSAPFLLPEMAGLMRGATPGRLIHGTPVFDQGEAGGPFPATLSAPLRACLRSRTAVGAFAVTAVLALAALSRLADPRYTLGPPLVIQPVTPAGGGAPGDGDHPLGDGSSTGAVVGTEATQGGGQGAVQGQ